MDKIYMPWIRTETFVEEIRLKRNIPKISIVIANYNNEKNIPILIESIQSQNFKDSFEIIVVDDMSSDKSTEEVLKFPDVNLIRLEKNSGSEALPQNIGLYFSKGEYVGFVDSDDYLLSRNTLEVMCKELDKNKTTTMAISNVIFQIETKSLGEMKWVLDNEIFTPENDISSRLRYKNNIISLNKRKAKSYSIYELLTHGYHIGFRVMRPTAVKEVGGWPIELGPSDDLGLLMRFAELEYKNPERKILPVDVDGYAYRITGENVSFAKNQDNVIYNAARNEVITRINSAGLSYAELKRNAPFEFWKRWKINEKDVM